VIESDEALAQQLADEDAENFGQGDEELALALAREFEAAAEMRPGAGVPAFRGRTENGFTSQAADDRPASPSPAQLRRLPTHSAGQRQLDEECPVCLEVSTSPIYSCDEQHIICSDCKPKVKICPECREPYPDKPRRHRYAEKAAKELEALILERAELLNSV